VFRASILGLGRDSSLAAMGEEDRECESVNTFISFMALEKVSWWGN